MPHTSASLASERARASNETVEMYVFGCVCEQINTRVSLSMTTTAAAAASVQGDLLSERKHKSNNNNKKDKARVYIFIAHIQEDISTNKQVDLPTSQKCMLIRLNYLFFLITFQVCVSFYFAHSSLDLFFGAFFVCFGYIQTKRCTTSKL